MSRISECLEDFRFERSSAHPALRAGEVHLWRAHIDAACSDDLDLLSAEETMRAERFVHLRDRVRYIAAHAALRRILAEYLDEEPAQLRFGRGAYGKPYVADTLLRFNLSHSEDLMLVAITTRGEIGVDIEAIRPNLAFEMLAEHYFAPQDQWSLRIAPAEQRLERFFEIWTRTEAELKALGIGLGHDQRTSNPSEYIVHSFEPAAGYAAALAVEGQPCTVSCFQWPR